jgi:hypothetical protein
LAWAKTALVEIKGFMDEIIEFIKVVFEEMYQLELKSRDFFISESEGEAFSEILDNKYFDRTTHGVAIFSQRLRTPENAARPMYSPSKVKAPIIFQVKEYDDAKWGKVYKVYASSTIASGSDIYFRVHYVAKVDGQWKIVGQDAASQGQFEHRNGENFDHLKNPTEIRKLQPPADPLDLEEYNLE